MFNVGHIPLIELCNGIKKTKQRDHGHQLKKRNLKRWWVPLESLQLTKKSFVAKWNISFCLLRSSSFVNGHYYSLCRHGTSTTHFFAQELLSFFFRGGLSKTLGHRFPFVKLSLQQQQHKYTHHFQQPKTTASTKLKLKVVQQQL